MLVSPQEKIQTWIGSPVDIGQIGELIHDADDAAVGGGTEPAVTHLAQLAIDDRRRRLWAAKVTAISGPSGTARWCPAPAASASAAAARELAVLDQRSDRGANTAHWLNKGVIHKRNSLSAFR
jgi:hypothetical protein